MQGDSFHDTRVTIAMTMAVTVAVSTMVEHEYPNDINKEAKYGDQEEALMFNLKHINNCIVISENTSLSTTKQYIYIIHIYQG